MTNTLLTKKILDFKNEKEFRQHIVKELENKKLYFSGYKLGKGYDTKKLIANILKIDENVKVEGREGRGDIIIHHDFLHLSHNHALASPLIIECKLDTSWKDAIHQANRYKINATKKYQNTGEYEFLEVAVTTPSLYQKESFCPEKCILECYKTNHAYCQQFDIKRIIWKLGIGLLEYNTREGVTKITFNEGDKITIR